MKKILAFLLMLHAPLYAACPPEASKLLGLPEDFVSKNDSAYTCPDLVFLYHSGLSGLPYEDYLKRFGDLGSKATDLIKKGITPEKIALLKEFKVSSIDDIFLKLKKEYSRSFSVSYDSTKKTFVSKDILCTSVSELPDFSTLPLASQPAYMAGNIIFDVVSRSMGSIIPSKTPDKALLKIGSFEKEISWKKECFENDTFSVLANAFTTCWTCPLYDFFFQVVSDLSYVIWHAIRLPMISLISLVFVFWLLIKILRMFWFQELNIDFFKKELIKRLGMLAIAGIFLGFSETGYDIAQDLVNLLLVPLADITTYLTGIFLNAGTCEYIPLTGKTAHTMFNPELKNKLLCLTEQISDVFVDYVILSVAFVLKSFSLIFEGAWELIKGAAKSIIPISGVSGTESMTEGIKMLLSFIFSFLLGLFLLFSFIGKLFQTLFYLIDPIFKMGMIFIWLPFSFLNWVLPDLGWGAGSTFSGHFKTLINGFLVMIFTAIIVSIVGTILLTLMSSVDSFSKLKEAIETKAFVDMFSAIDLDSTILLRLIVGIIIMNTLMKNISGYANKYMQTEIDTKVWDQIKQEFNTTYQAGKKKFDTLKSDIGFFKKK